MKTKIGLLSVLWFVCLAGAQTTNQTFTLRNGWNAIWLELEPTNPAIASVFGSLPVSSIWTYVAKDTPVQFIQQQTEQLFNEPRWLPHFPPGRPEAILTKLYEVHALRAYLVNLTNVVTPITLTVTGTPVVRDVPWIGDSFNLRGFPVNPAQLPTFDTFFVGSAAHRGQSVFELQADGQWHLVPGSAQIRRGEAYWSYCNGASTFSGPTGITLDFGTGLFYGPVLTELMPTISNPSSSSRTVCLRDLSTGANNPFSYASFFSNRLNWVNLPAPYCFSLDPGRTLDLRLAVRRTAFAGSNYVSIIEVTDDVGTRYLVPVSAQKLTPARPSVNGIAGLGNQAAGLWVGSVTVTNVNEANSTQPMNLTPTRSPFDLRLLIHVDASGQARLLKEVIQMWQNGTMTNNAQGRLDQDRGGRYVLLTDDTRIPQFRGASLRDGVPVGRRISSIDFDFDGGTNNVLAMTGAFDLGKTNLCTIVLEPNFATNPFKHRFHPDHDNLDPTFRNFKEEAYRIVRNLELRYSMTDPAGTNTLAAFDYGINAIGGVYRETITGLHRTNIVAQGTFRLTRVSNSPVLNQ
jgi:hypothetical protein